MQGSRHAVCPVSNTEKKIVRGLYDSKTQDTSCRHGMEMLLKQQEFRNKNAINDMRL